MYKASVDGVDLGEHKCQCLAHSAVIGYEYLLLRDLIKRYNLDKTLAKALNEAFDTKYLLKSIECDCSKGK